MNRRGNNEGSLFQDKKKGRWVVSIHIGYRDGRRLRRSFTFRTKQEAIDKLTAARHLHSQGALRAGKMPTLGEWLRRWLGDISLRPSTMRSYESITRLHLIPVLGHIRLDKLSIQDVKDLVANKGKVFEPGQVVHIHAVLRGALNAAMREDLIFRNVAKLVKLPKVPDYEAISLSVEQAHALLDAAKGDLFEAIYSVALPLGLREGEALGLRWDDVDFANREIHVRKQLLRCPGEKPYLQIADVKTKRSRRTLALPEVSVRALQAHRARQLEMRLRAGPNWQEHGLVFASPHGGPVDASVMLRRFWVIRAVIGLPKLRFHDLRHSAISILGAQNIPLRVAMEVAGHTQISTTAEIYAHVTDEQKRQAARAMDAVFPAASAGNA